jgi:hypothetical protein
MSHGGILKAALKRGGLLAAANWQVVVIQFVAESTFKLLLAIPVAGGAVLVAVLLGRDFSDVLRGDLRDAVASIAGGLGAQPVTLAAFLLAFLLVLLGGSALTFLAKGGTVTVLAAADRLTGPVERPPVQWDAFVDGAQFSVELFTAGATALFRRYLVLGLALIGAYGLSAMAYLAVLYVGYRVSSDGALLLGWTVVAVVLSSVLIVWITIVNLLYLLIQIVVAVSGRGVWWSAGEVLRVLRKELWDIVGVFSVILVLVVLATGASLGATAGLGLIAFAPLAGLAVLPLQLGAWLIRSFAFQYLGLTAVAAYLYLYRTRGPGSAEPGPATGRHEGRPDRDQAPRAHSTEHTP